MGNPLCRWCCRPRRHSQQSPFSHPNPRTIFIIAWMVDLKSRWTTVSPVKPSTDTTPPRVDLRPYRSAKAGRPDLASDMWPPNILLAFPLAAAATHALDLDHRPATRDTHYQIRKRGCSDASQPHNVLAAATPISSSSTDTLTTSSTSTPSLEVSVSPASHVLAMPSVVTASIHNAQSTGQSTAFGSVAIATGFKYGTDKVRGVNLGGWLVLESFISPSVFSATGNDGIVDEWTFCQYQDRSTAETALRKHWDTFITEDDFGQMAAAGINHVRIPVGYWAWDVQGDEPYVQGAADYLERAIGWARSKNIKVLIDLHGVPGSQNGYDHSGRKGDAVWHTDQENVKRSVDVVRTIAARYGTSEYSDTVTMLELLNEPTLWLNDEIKAVTKQYCLDAYQAARRPWSDQADKKTDLIIVFHDGFQEMAWWKDYMIGDGLEKIWIDDHYYQAFKEEDFNISAEEHLRLVCSARSNYQTSPFPSIAGEWSIAVWSCTPAERTTGMGNVGTCDLSEDNAMPDYATFLRAFWDTQVQMFENAGQGQGWFYFNWKTESLTEWSYQKSLETGWIPRSLGEYQFNLDTICSAG